MTAKSDSSRIEALGRSLEERYRSKMCVRFPYEDCRHLHKRFPSIADGLVPDLDMYFSFIAGFSSSASRLDERPYSQISSAIPRLRLSFFKANPQYNPLARELRTPECKRLFEALRDHDQARIDLLTIMKPLAKKDG